MMRSARIALYCWAALSLLVAASLGVIYLRLGAEGFGIFIQTIGLEPVKYSKRFTFDQAFLSSGINLIVVPRPGTISPWSSKATDIIHNCGLDKVHRVERGIVY